MPIDKDVSVPNHRHHRSPNTYASNLQGHPTNNKASNKGPPFSPNDPSSTKTRTPMHHDPTSISDLRTPLLNSMRSAVLNTGTNVSLP